MMLHENKTEYRGRRSLCLFPIIIIAAVVLTVCSLFVVSASDDARAEDPTSGSCGEHITWDYNSESKTLTLQGHGDMYDYARLDDVPWYSIRKDIEHLNFVNDEGGITRIGDRAFNECHGLTSLSLPSTVKIIGVSAFTDCENIGGDLIIPNSVTTICDDAFFFCKSFTSLTIPDSVTAIGEGAFRSCFGFTEIEIPDSVTTIGDNAFNYCVGMKTLTLPNNLESIGIRVFEDCQGLLSLTIPDSVTTIGEGAFAGCKAMKTLKLSENLESIGKESFHSCTSLEALTIPDSVTSIGSGAFNNCYGITELVLSKNLTSIGSGAFNDCKNIKGHLVIPEGITSISEHTFDRCSGFTALTLPKNLESIGHDAFHECTEFRGELRIPDSVKTIDYAAFESCGFTSLILPDGVETIGERAFNNCQLLEGTLKIPSSVKSISNEAFEGLYKITALIIPEGVESIGERAFMGLNNATGDLWIPDSVTSIGDYAFASCHFNGTLHLPANITSIGNHVFDGDWYFKGTLNIPSSVTSIGEYAFNACYDFDSLSIPNKSGSINIGSSAFGVCTGLTSLYLPYCVKEIGDYAFTGCTNITKMAFEGGLTKVSKNAFYSHTFYTLKGEKLELVDDPRFNIIAFKNKVYVASDGIQHMMQTYSVYFNLNEHGPQGVETQHIIPGHKVTEPDAPVDASYLFSGWYKESGCVNKWDFLTDTVGDNITLYAKWTVCKLTVTFDGNGSTSGTMDQQVIMSTDSAKTLKPNSFTKPGYEFVGWNTKADGTGTNYSDGADISSLITSEDSTLELYAQWKEYKLTVTFDGNGSTSGSMDQQVIMYTGTSKTLNKNAFAKTEYVFANWNTKADGTGKNYEDAADVSALLTGSDATLTLYAQWMDFNTHRVMYDIDGGSADAPAYQYVKEGETFVIASYGGTKEGYTFGGWSYDGKTYKAGDSLTMGTTDIKLKAVWTPASDDPDEPSSSDILMPAIGIAALAVVALGFIGLLFKMR